MWVWMSCLYVLTMWQTGDLSRVYPGSCPVTAEIVSSPTVKPELDKQQKIIEWVTFINCVNKMLILRMVLVHCRRSCSPHRDRGLFFFTSFPPQWSPLARLFNMVMILINVSTRQRKTTANELKHKVLIYSCIYNLCHSYSVSLYVPHDFPSSPPGCATPVLLLAPIWPSLWKNSGGAPWDSPSVMLWHDFNL